MFTGLIEELGTIRKIETGSDSAKFTIEAEKVLHGVKHGDSIAIDGVCLTVIDWGTDFFVADVMGQTLKLTTLSLLAPSAKVNLERAMALGDRLGGHIVQGHTEGTAKLLQSSQQSDWRVLRFSLPDELAPLLVPQGSITVNGVSLTVSGLSEAETTPKGSYWFEVSLIPETLVATNLGELKLGSSVNLETDILARHVKQLLKF